MKQRLTTPFVLALGIVLFGGFLRFFRLEANLMFQGDQGRDAIVVKKMLKEGDFTLLGPVTSIGNMYLGPFYYYFMLPFMVFTYPNPIGPAIGVALVGTLTIFLVYLCGKEVFGERAGLVTALCYTILYDALFYSRFSWNPNIAPLFGLMIFWFLFRFLKLKNPMYFAGAVGLFGLLIQLHYIALLMGAVIGLSFLWAVVRWKDRWKSLTLHLFLGMLLFSLTQLPLVIFDLKHDHLILNSFRGFLNSDEEALKPDDGLWRVIQEFEGKSFRVLAQGIESPNGTTDRIITWGIFAVVIFLIVKNRSLRKNYGFWLLLLWLGMAIVGISFYRGSVYDHYLSYLFPAIALLAGLLIEKVSRFKYGFVIAGFLFIGYAYLNLSKPIFGKTGESAFAPYNSVAQYILPRAKEPYNIVLLSRTGDYKGMNYRYFLEVSEKTPLEPDEYNNLKTLFVIDELNTPNPLEVPIYEIQSTGLTSVSKPVEAFKGVQVFVLTQGEE